MSDEYDILMNLDDKLELDAIIEEWNPDPGIVDVNPSDTNSDYTHTGIQTRTSIFDPNDPDIYNINING
jgi:hypothetical protein